MGRPFPINQKRFEFEGRRIVPIGLIVAGVGLLSFFGYFGFIRFGLSVGFCASMFFMALIIAFIFYFRVGQIHSDLIVDDSGMRRELLGIKWAHLSWSDAKQITVVKSCIPGESRLTWFVLIHTYKRTLGWLPFKNTVMFTERTKDKDELVATVNKYAKRCNIGIFQKRKGPSGGGQWCELESLHLNTDSA